MHPELVRRFVAARADRAQRRHPGGAAVPPTGRRAAGARRCACAATSALDYAGAVLACELLARIDAARSRLRRPSPTDDSTR